MNSKKMRFEDKNRMGVISIRQLPLFERHLLPSRECDPVADGWKMNLSLFLLKVENE
jgi:hypothetical protein